MTRMTLNDDPDSHNDSDDNCHDNDNTHHNNRTNNDEKPTKYFDNTENIYS